MNLLFKKVSNNFKINNKYRSFVVKNRNKRKDYSYASTGILTQLLIQLLLNKKIKYVIISQGNYINGYKLIKTNSVQEIINSAGSIYENFDLVKKFKNEILDDIDSDFAIVTLPCEYRIIQNILKKYKKSHFCKYHFVLICGGLYKKGTTNYLIQNYLNIKEEEILNFSYRGTIKNGFEVSTKKRIVSKDKSFFNWANYVFYEKKCYFCKDFIFEGPDGFFGDSWKLVNNGSLIIVKKDIIPFLDKLDNFEKYEIDEQQIIKSQLSIYLWKKINNSNLYKYFFSKKINFSQNRKFIFWEVTKRKIVLKILKLFYIIKILITRNTK